MALLGAIIGLISAHKWGGFKTVMGRALTFFSIGLLLQEAGQLIYTYYVYGAHVQIPYPSLGDVAYFGSTLSYICGAALLAKAMGVKFALKMNRYKVIATLIPAILIALSYFIFLRGHEYDFSKPLTVFLDFGYPVGEAVYISLALAAYLISKKMLGGAMRPGIILIIFALVIQYTADFTFIYQSNRGTYLSGKYVDLLYLSAYFTMTIAMIKFYLIYKNLKSPKKVVAK